MRNFHCEQCGQLAFFENFECLQCGALLGLIPESFELAAFRREAGAWMRVGGDGGAYRQCENYAFQQICNGMVAQHEPDALCRACRFTVLIPDLDKSENRTRWYRFELAKRRLLSALTRLGLPLADRSEDPQRGLAFRFIEKSSSPAPGSSGRVFTGHSDGVITANLAEADDVERERVRSMMREPYRTLLGHMRHESGHYYWMRLIDGSALRDEFDALFGPADLPYAPALQSYYALGAPPDWPQQYISAYCAAHPWEDFAETWAHYLHIEDTLDTAQACGLALSATWSGDPMLDPARSTLRPQSFEEAMQRWIAIAYALNSLNRSLGLNDAYPFVLAQRVTEKLAFVDRVIHAGSSRRDW